MAGKRKGKPRGKSVGKESIPKRSRNSTRSTTSAEEIPSMSTTTSGTMETTTTSFPSTSTSSREEEQLLGAQTVIENGGENAASSNLNGDNIKIKEPYCKRWVTGTDKETVIIVLASPNPPNPDGSSKKLTESTDTVNVPIIAVDSNNDDEPKFNSKAEVIRFFQEKSPELLENLNEPGHFANIILTKKATATSSSSSFLKIFQLAMIKWNAGTDTNIQILYGGVSAILKMFPGMDVVYDDSTVSPPLTLTPIPESISAEAKILMQGFQNHLRDLELAIETTEALLELRDKRKSFDSIKNVLLQEHESIIIKDLEDQIPDEVKCKICLQIYSGDIMECENGHSVCKTCAERNNSCLKCGLAFNKEDGLKRDLEFLFLTKLRSECSCGEFVMFRDIKSHAKICASEKKKSKEVAKLDDELSLMEREIQSGNQHLVNMNEQIAGSEQQWNDRFGSWGEDVIPIKECKKVLEKIHKMKMALTSSSVSLFRTIFDN